MNQQLPDRFSSRGNENVGNIHIEAPVAGGIVQIGHGNRMVIQLQVLGAKDATLRLDQQNPLLQQLIQTLADGNAQASVLASRGFSPNIAAPSLRPEDLRLDSPFTSPLGTPAPLAWDAEQLARNFSSLDGFLRQLDQQFGGVLAGMTDGKQSLNVSDLLLQKGNLAFWRFRQGALCLFAEQASLYALAEPQNPAQPMLQAFQVAARTNLDVCRSWVLFQKYRMHQPALIDQAIFSALSQGQWQAVLNRWKTEQRLSNEQVQAEWSYLNAIGQRYDPQAVQMAVREAEGYFTEALRRQPNQSAALVNLAALLSESALLAYIETGTADRARLHQAQNLFQQAHTLLAQHPDRNGQIALAQCLLYEATSLPPDARLEMIRWAASQAQRLRVALGQNAPGSVRWDIAQRNLARRDPSFIDQEKIKQVRDILIGVGAMAILIALADQWLSAHTQIIEGTNAEMGQPNSGGSGYTDSVHGQVSGAHAVPTPDIQSNSHASSGVAGGELTRHGVKAAKVTSKGVIHKLLGTLAGKIVAAAVATTVVAAGVTTSVVVIPRIFSYPPLASAYHGTATIQNITGTVPFDLTSITQNQQEVKGNVSSLAFNGNGTFTGTIGTDRSLNFTVTPSSGTPIVNVSGTLQTDGSLDGTYTAPSVNQQGTWHAVPVSSSTSFQQFALAASHSNDRLVNTVILALALHNPHTDDP